MIRWVALCIVLLTTTFVWAGAPKQCPPGYHNRCGSTCKVVCVEKNRKGKCLRKEKRCPRPSCYCERDLPLP